MIIINFPFAPVAKGRPRLGKHGAYTPAKTRAYENEIKLWASKHAPKKPLEGPIRVSVYFFIKMPKKAKNGHCATRPDLDNYLKGLLDALNGLLWHDDAQVAVVYAVKVYDESRPNGGISLSVEEM